MPSNSSGFFEAGRGGARHARKKSRPISRMPRFVSRGHERSSVSQKKSYPGEARRLHSASCSRGLVSKARFVKSRKFSGFSTESAGGLTTSTGEGNTRRRCCRKQGPETTAPAERKFARGRVSDASRELGGFAGEPVACAPGCPPTRSITSARPSRRPLRASSSCPRPRPWRRPP